MEAVAPIERLELLYFESQNKNYKFIKYEK